MKSRKSNQLDLGDLESAHGFLLSWALKPVFRNFLEHFDDLGVSPRLFSILLLIHRNPGCKQSDIGTALGALQTNLVRRVDFLIEQGWVRRDPDTQDRRAKVLHLTSAGARLMKEAQRRHRAHLKEMNRLDPDSSLLNALARFIANAQAEQSSDAADLADDEDA